jgi:hypothetical protein
MTDILPPVPMKDIMQREDTLQAICAWLTREQAGFLLATTCKAAANFVQKTDEAEEAGSAQWHVGRPMWDLQRIEARIDAGWPEPNTEIPGLAAVLKSLANLILTCLVDEAIVLTHKPRLACIGVQASVLGCHSMQVRDPVHFLITMETWIETQRHTVAAHPTVIRYSARSKPHEGPHLLNTLLVINLLRVLGLRARRGRGMRFGPASEVDSSIHPNSNVFVSKHEALWVKEYIAEGMSTRGWT